LTELAASFNRQKSSFTPHLSDNEYSRINNIQALSKPEFHLHKGSFNSYTPL